MNHADDNSPLTNEFEAACNDPQGTDFGFVEQRRESGFANFGFDPDEAARMRDEADFDNVDEDFDEDEDDGWLDLDDEDDDDYDRYADSYGFDDGGDDSEIDNWE